MDKQNDEPEESPKALLTRAMREFVEHGKASTSAEGLRALAEAAETCSKMPS